MTSEQIDRRGSPRHVAPDRAWDELITRLIREAAEVREERERARMSEDALLARREAAALMEAIRAHGRPRVKHYVSRPSSRRAPGSSGAPPPPAGLAPPAGLVAHG